MDYFIIIFLPIILFALLLILLVNLFNPVKFHTALRYFNEKKYNKAVVVLNRLIKKDRHNSDAYFLLAKCYIGENKLKQALSELLMINKIGKFTQNCLETEFRETIINVYKQLEMPQDALQEYILLIKIEPNNPQYYFEAASFLEQFNKQSKALEFYYKTIKLDPTFIDAYIRCGLILLGKNNINESQKFFDGALKIQPDYPYSYYGLGKIAKIKGNYNLAIDYLKKIEFFSELENSVIQERGECYLLLNDNENAIDYFSQLEKNTRDKDPQLNLEARYYLGIAYEQSQKYDEALTFYKRIQTVNPHYRDIQKRIQRFQVDQTKNTDTINYNDQIKDYLTLNAADFQNLCKLITESYNMKIDNVTEITSGCEIFANLVDANKWIASQAYKQVLLWFLRNSNIVTESTVSSFIDVMKQTKCVKGYIFSGSDFTPNAKQYAINRSVDLIPPVEIQKILNSLKDKL